MHSAVPGSSGNFSQSTNRITSAFGATVSYDNAGNVTNHPYIANITYYADGLPNQFSSATFNSFTTFNYTYDAQGQRVRKVVDLPGPADEVTVYVYDAFGKLAAEYSNSSMAQEVGIWFRTPDHLGSTRIVTDAGQTVRLRRDYFPFGEQIPADSSHGNRHLVLDNGVANYTASLNFTQQFTGKERDPGSGLDYFGARYFSAPMGRFLSMDPDNAGAGLADPQTWNAYAYVSNRPLIMVDEDGRIGNVALGALVGTGVGLVAGVVREVQRTGSITNIFNSESAANIGKSTLVGFASGTVAGATFGLLAPAVAPTLTTALGGEVALQAGSQAVLNAAVPGFTSGVTAGIAGRAVQTGDALSALGDSPVTTIVDGGSGAAGQLIVAGARAVISQGQAAGRVRTLSGQLDSARTPSRIQKLEGRLNAAQADVGHRDTAGRAAGAAAAGSMRTITNRKEPDEDER